MKLIIQLLGCIAIVCASFSSFAASTYDFEANGVKYIISSLPELTVEVVGVLNKDIGNLDIPQTVEYKGKFLTVTSIGNNSLSNLTQLTSVSLPASILSIGSEAFLGDTRLKVITLPENLTTLGASVFKNCSSLESIDIPEDINYIPDYSFMGCSNLNTMPLNDNLLTIGAYAFSGTGITNIEFPPSLQEIGPYAFSGTKLEYAEVPNNVECIDGGCFSDCINLKIAKLYCSEMGGGVFIGCTSLSHIELPQNLVTMRDFMFYGCTSLTNIELPQNLAYIGDSAFYGCTNLLELSIPSSVTEIEPSIVWNCPNLSKLKIGRGLNGLPVYAKCIDWPIEYECKTLGSYHYKYESVSTSKHEEEIYLKGMKQVIIENSDNPFSIKGFGPWFDARPAFVDADLDYFYVGRPLDSSEKWTYEIGYDLFTCNYKQGTGHIKTLEISGNCTENPYFYQKVDTLILGSKFKLFDPENLYINDIKTIECHSSIPPKFANNVDMPFPTKVYTDVVLYVPAGCKSAYSSATGWKYFWNIEEKDFPSSVEASIVNNDFRVSVNNGIITMSGCEENVVIYDMQGRMVYNGSDKVISGLPSGIYIVKAGVNITKISI